MDLIYIYITNLPILYRINKITEALIVKHCFGSDCQSYTIHVLICILQPCNRTTPIPGDGIDNDCDGKIDEELCTAANNQKGKNTKAARQRRTSELLFSLTVHNPQSFEFQKVSSSPIKIILIWSWLTKYLNHIIMNNSTLIRGECNNLTLATGK